MYCAFKIKQNKMLLDCQGKKFLPNWKGWLLEGRIPVRERLGTHTHC
jgi:hypothetical protein